MISVSGNYHWVQMASIVCGDCHQILRELFS